MSSSEDESSNSNSSTRPLDKLSANIVRLALSTESKRSSLKRDEIIKTALKSQRYLFDSAMIRANEQLKMLFGYKLQELPPKESANEPEFETENTGTKSYILINNLESPQNYADAWDRFENVSSIGILHTILAIMMGNGGTVSDVQLYSSLKKLGLLQLKTIPGESKQSLESFVSQLVRQNYLEKKKSLVGTHDWDYSWGSRSLIEIGQTNINNFILAIMSRFRPQMSSEATKDFDNKITDDLQRALGHKFNS